MRRLALILGFSALPVLLGWGQSSPTNRVMAVTQEGRRTSIEEAPPFMAPTTNQHVYFIRQRGVTDGVIPKLRRTKNPLQLINPLAPKSYGSGWENVAVNPASGRAEGVSVLRVGF